MTTYEIEYIVTSREGMVLEADDREQAAQFTRESVDDLYGSDMVSYEIVDIKEID